MQYLKITRSILGVIDRIICHALKIRSNNLPSSFWAPNCNVFWMYFRIGFWPNIWNVIDFEINWNENALHLMLWKLFCEAIICQLLK